MTRHFTGPALLTLLAACAGSEAAAPPPRNYPTVRLARVIDSSVREPLVAAGTLTAKDEPVLSFKVGGVVARISVDAGDRVRAGQVLAVLGLTEIDAAVTRARAGLEKAERDLARLERLARDSVATAVQVQDARTARELAEADLSAARFNRSYAVITAPAAGTVLRRHVREGEVVTAGAAVLTLASAARGTVFRVDLADRDLIRVRNGDPARVTLDADPARALEGTVSEIGAAPTQGLGTYTVEIALPAAAGLPNGLVGRARIAVGEPVRTALVPIESLVEADGQEGTVFVVEADSVGPDSLVRVRRRAVRVGALAGAAVTLRGGLAPARWVVTDGAAWLNDSMLVKVVP